MRSTSIIELIDFTPGWERALALFFEALSEAGELAFFNPHPHDVVTLQRIAARTGVDVYCLLVEEDRVMGYGLLRGWDAGYDVPSLGVAVHPSHRCGGLGKFLMEYLEMMAGHRGATKLRLRVKRNNRQAISLYTKLGYFFSDDADDALLVGYKDLGKRHP